jgi:hypothetical protein
MHKLSETMRAGLASAHATVFNADATSSAAATRSIPPKWASSNRKRQNAVTRTLGNGTDIV